MKKKLNKEVKDLISSQIEIEGFDYAMVEKISPNDWDEGVVPKELKDAWEGYLTARIVLKSRLREYGIDPM